MLTNYVMITAEIKSGPTSISVVLTTLYFPKSYHRLLEQFGSFSSIRRSHNGCGEDMAHGCSYDIHVQSLWCVA